MTVSNMNDFQDPTDRNYFVKLWPKLSAKKTPVEKDSIYRQHETARQALMGKTPPDHIFLFQRGLVPVPVRGITNLEDLKRSFDLCEDYLKPPFGSYPEKSDKDTSISVKYPALFRSFPWSKELPFQLPEGSVSSRPGSGVSDGEADQALKDEKRSSERSDVCPRLLGYLEWQLLPCPPDYTACRSLALCLQKSFSHEEESVQHRRHSVTPISRPGSNTKPTLPPIPHGRKWTSA